MTFRLAVAALVLSSLVGAEPITELKAPERAKVERKAEPVTNGIPLPQGLVKDVSELSLKKGAADVPAAFSVLSKWPADGSIRWALIDAQLDVPAGGEVKLQLVKSKPAEPAGKLEVLQADDSIIVDTGVVSFKVRKKGFRLFESLSLNGKPVLGAPAGGLTMTVGGDTFTTADDADSKVSVEEQNLMRVALLATGKLTDKAGKTAFDYQVRIHAYRGSAEIKVVATVVKKYGKRNDAAKVSDLSIELPLAMIEEAKSLTSTAAFGTDKAPVSGVTSIHVDSSDSFKLSDGKGGKCKSVKPLTLGWGDLTRGEVGIAAGVRRFWENFPKAIEVRGDTLIVHLYPSMQAEPVEVYSGVARTHEVLLVPHEKATVQELQAKFVAFQRPLYAFASPKWYCRDSGGLGLLAEDDPKLFGASAAAASAFTDKFSKVLDTLAGPAQDDWHGRGGVVMDAYGWLAYGDTLHWVWLKGQDEGVKQAPGTPWTIVWDGNYYDMPHVALQHFARTGKAEYFDFFVDHSWHLMDVDVVHYDPGSPAGGGSRRCPATNHVGFDPPEHDSPTVNYAFDHHKSESLFERYYFLGDRWALASATELLNHAFSPVGNGGKNGDYGGTRKPGHQIMTLVAGYWCTGDKKYLEKAREVINTGIERQKANDGGFNPKANFTDGICSEAFSKYYLATGEKDVLEAVKNIDDFLIAKKTKFGNPAMGYGLAFNKTGDKKYLEAGLNELTVKPGHLGKDSADEFRNAANFLGLVAEKLGERN